MLCRLLHDFRLSRCNRAMRFLKRRGVVESLFGQDVANRLEPVIRDGARKKLMLWRDKAKQRMLEERMNEKVGWATRG